jgi:hypothetical protein
MNVDSTGAPPRVLAQQAVDDVGGISRLIGPATPTVEERAAVALLVGRPF